MPATYTVQLRASIDHLHGPEPEWDPVAEAAVRALEGETLTTEGGARLEVVDVYIDQAES